MAQRVGILTFHDADNQGAVLQAYGLQTALSGMPGVLPEVLDYRCDEVEATRKTAAGGMKRLAMGAYYALKHRNFCRFRAKYLKRSRMCYTRETIAEAVKHYDLFITGSDQVWNLECSGHDTAYFLDFVPDKGHCCSYAASLGNYHFTEEEQRWVGQWVTGFRGISVREGSAVEELKKAGISGAQVHPDPVFLLSSRDWQRVMSPRLDRKYVFVYLIQEDVHVLAAARDYAKKHGCKIVNNKTSLKYILKGSPSDFLSWIYYADAVFTNSFHGTAFSIIFGKKLGADVVLRGGGTNNRIMELLKAVRGENNILQDEARPVGSEFNTAALQKMSQDARRYLQSMTEMEKP